MAHKVKGRKTPYILHSSVSKFHYIMEHGIVLWWGFAVRWRVYMKLIRYIKGCSIWIGPWKLIKRPPSTSAIMGTFQAKSTIRLKALAYRSVGIFGALNCLMQLEFQKCVKNRRVKIRHTDIQTRVMLWKVSLMPLWEFKNQSFNQSEAPGSW